MSRPHERLDVWKESINLVKVIYTTTKRLPKEEIYGLTQQMRRSVVSVASNIAEGAARQTKSEFKQFLYIARGSLSELETQIMISFELKYISETDMSRIFSIADHVSKMLSGLIARIK